ncbi:MBL fold metallo-hydrolase [uncultured Peptoniphilus sp.]|uniref:MBL fold metallo-hydrolase n=1 Tax=uncultured Peptoniphilus sp. TaxID=254354 RepID=UPI002804C2AD|nr:MBL fold metallo-hydrolase [uncultured Peptoniphilus sp.]
MKIEVIASGSAGNCYKLSNEDTTLLIECGIPYLKIQEKLNFKLSDIDACFISHEHKDHSRDYKKLLDFGTKVYMTEGTKATLDPRDYRIEILEREDQEFYKDFKIGSFKIKPFKTIHDAKEPVGFLIKDLISKESLVFITDSKYCKYKFSVDYMLLEVNYTARAINQNPNLNPRLRKRIKETHMSLETAIDFILKSDLKRLKMIYLIHLSENNSEENYIKESIQKLTGVPVYVC